MTIRILVVDDSVVVRKLLTTTLNEVPGMEVIATAQLGTIALAKIPQCNPDVVILDIEMPEMDGIETLKQIRKLAPRLPVIMFSTRTDHGAAATIEALTSGASDYVCKPSNVGNVLLAMARVREEMVPKIQALAAGARARATGAVASTAARAPGTLVASSQPLRARPPGGTPAPPFRVTGAIPPAGSPPSPGDAEARRPATGALPVAHAPRAFTPGPPPSARLATAALPVPAPLGSPASGEIRTRPNRPSAMRAPVEIVAIGASTGGPNALSILLGQLPADFPVPIVIVQHMLATFTRHFAERLATQCRIQIVEASAGDALVPGRAYIARGDHHLLVERRAGRVVVALNQGEVENFCRPAVDVLFRSVAQTYGAAALAVVLTGMGHDGLLGCGAIRDAGGEVIVQDEASSVVWGMPGIVARGGLASQVLPVDLLGSEVRRRVALGVRITDGRS